MECFFYHPAMAARANRSEGTEGGGRDPLLIAFGDVLRDFRKSRTELTQAQLSARAGLPSNAIGDLERGERTVKAEELKSICKVLQVGVRLFLEKVLLEQLAALGERAEGEEIEGAEPAQEPELLYFGVAVARSGGKPEDFVKILHRMIKMRGPVDGKEGA